MLAPTVALIPLFGLLQQLHIYDSYWALVVLYTAFRIPFTTFLIRAYMIDIPSEVDEAAKLDGCTPTQAFWQIILPMCRPILVSAALLQALFAWNEFVFAIFLTSSDSVRSAPPAIAGLIGDTTVDWGLVDASSVVFALPVLIFAYLVRKHLVAGVTLGAVRR